MGRPGPVRGGVVILCTPTQDVSGKIENDPVVPPRHISLALDRAVSLREYAYIEASKLHDAVDRSWERLNCVRGKWLAVMGTTLTTL